MDSAPKKTGFFTARNAGKNDLSETIKTVIIAVVLAVLFRSLIFEPFHIPSGSMKSNLLIGDYLFVSKFSYGYSHYSFPFGLIPIEGRILSTPPKRGDVVVFRPPGSPDTDYIKRLIGLPGDRIQVKDSVLYINDKPLPKEYVDSWTDTDKVPPLVLKRFRETMPEGKSYLTLNEEYPSAVENTGVYTVPEKHYFMMGDNRDNSRDSRYLDGPVGFVPEENLIGRAELILFSWHRLDRFFIRIP